ncbi:MAG: DUF4097 domain-containing protein [Gemmatimonas sp.]|jgi:lia operon protein LiaG|uniref:DUF4097 family beta strand repeat-containing protein n=1 Tax=Gemmatimonas sp. TaxID=1962908 RepID=UPI0031C0CF92|nr:DUF4097 domain-containing protein [Gemmatimonas sp.]
MRNPAPRSAFLAIAPACDGRRTSIINAARTLRLLAGLVLASTALAPEVRAQSERKTLSGSSVAIYNLAGNVSVESGRGSDVVVEVTRRGSDARELRVETSEIGGRQTLRVVYPDDDIIFSGRRDSWGSTEVQVNDDGTWGGKRWRGGRKVRIRSRGRGTEAWADVRILVPEGKSVAAYVAVGELSANNVNGNFTIDCGSGRTTAANVRGSLSVDVGSGGVNVRDSDLDQLTIDTGSGGVSLSRVTALRCVIDTGLGGVQGDNASCDELSVDVGSGGVRFVDSRSSAIRVDAGRGTVSMTLRNSPRSVNIESGSGGVLLGVPGSLSADIDIETGSGGIETDFMLRTTRVERNHVRGVIGDGAGRIRIETGSGSVTLRRN